MRLVQVMIDILAGAARATVGHKSIKKKLPIGICMGIWRHMAPSAQLITDISYIYGGNTIN